MTTGTKNKIAYIDDARASRMRNLCRCVSVWWQHLVRMSVRRPRRLRLCESLPLGDRRFVAVIEFEKARFLVGGTSSSLALLATLGENENAGVSVPTAAAGEPQADARTELRNEQRTAERNEERSEQKREECH